VELHPKSNLVHCAFKIRDLVSNNCSHFLDSQLTKLAHLVQLEHVLMGDWEALALPLVVQTVFSAKSVGCNCRAAVHVDVDSFCLSHICLTSV